MELGLLSHCAHNVIFGLGFPSNRRTNTDSPSCLKVLVHPFKISIDMERPPEMNWYLFVNKYIFYKPRLRHACQPNLYNRGRITDEYNPVKPLRTYFQTKNVLFYVALYMTPMVMGIGGHIFPRMRPFFPVVTSAYVHCYHQHEDHEKHH